MMKNCWENDVAQRPTFKQLRLELELLLPAGTLEGYAKFDSNIEKLDSATKDSGEM